MIEVSVCALVRPTERPDKVASAIENIFPGLIMDIRDDQVQAYDGLDSLVNFHDLLRDQRILDTARRVMERGLAGSSFQFKLNKQAALMGKVSFPPEEEPLGSIHVEVIGGKKVIDWLAPETEGGEPIMEVDIDYLRDNEESPGDEE